MHPLFRFALVATPLAALVFLALSSFFTAWDGKVVSHRPSPDVDPAVFTVLIVTEDGDPLEADWPAEVVGDLPLDIDPTGTPPSRLRDDAPSTRKQAFTMFFTVTPQEEGATTVTVPTTSPRALSVAVIGWFLGLGLFNMARSGSPFSWEKREVGLPELQEGTGQVHREGTGRTVSRKGPPPPKPRRGGGRRR